MRSPRFVKEYANYRIRKIQMESDIDKDSRIEKIKKAVRLCDRGLISADEAVGIILRT